MVDVHQGNHKCALNVPRENLLCRSRAESEWVPGAGGEETRLLMGMGLHFRVAEIFWHQMDTCTA